MAVIIMHPTEELKLINFQKEVISELYTEGRILVAARPLWIPLNTVVEPVETTAELTNCEVSGSFDEFNHRNFLSIKLGDLEVSDNTIFIPVEIETKESTCISKLTLVRLHKGNSFTDSDYQKLSQKKQPVRQLKVFRLGNEKELSPVSKCISDSKWIKLHHSTTTIQ